MAKPDMPPMLGKAAMPSAVEGDEDELQEYSDAAFDAVKAGDKAAFRDALEAFVRASGGSSM